MLDSSKKIFVGGLDPTVTNGIINNSYKIKFFPQMIYEIFFLILD